MDARMPHTAAKAAVCGFTLIECMVSLTIAAVMLVVAVPAMSELAERSRAAREMLELRSLLELARQTAVMDQVDITLCGTSDGSSCSANWKAQPTLVFHDRNANRILDPGERLFAHSRLTESGSIDWRGSNGRRYLRFRTSGGVKEFGTFLYCPASANVRHARALVVSAAGHLRATRDTNGDGIAEDASGKALSCPL